MTNFVPLKNASLRVMDELIGAHGIQGPFLDAGCGRGDVSEHLAKMGWEGTAADSSPDAVNVAKDALKNYPSVRVETGDLMKITGSFRTIVSTSVIEHVRDDVGLLRHFRGCFLPQGGWLILVVPTNPTREWRWDDAYYGHYRRYDKLGLQRLLSECGFAMLDFCDYTFPVFWAMRRAYTRFLPPKAPLSAIPEENTAASSLQSAWDMGLLSRVVAALPVWPAVAAMQKPFRHGSRGFEAVVVAATK